MATRSSNKPPDAVRPQFSASGWAKTKLLLGFLRPYTWHFVAGMFFLVLGSLIFMAFPLATGELIDIAAGKSKYGLTLSDLGWALIVILVVQSVAAYLRVWLFTHISERGLADIRALLYQKLIHQQLSFLEQERVGELTSRSTADIQQLQDVFSVSLAEFFRQIIMLIGGLAIIVWSAPRLALLMIITLPVVILSAVFFGRYIRRLSKQRQDEMAKTAVILEETLQAISVVKAFGNETHETARYTQAIKNVVAISMRFARIRGLFIVFIIAVLFGLMFFVLWSGAAMVQSGEISNGVLVSFIVNTAIVGGAMASLGDFYTQMLRAIASSERIMDIIALPTEMEYQPNPILYPTLNGNIVFDKVAFRYPARPELEILSNLSFRVETGQKIAIVGASGAGKSTIIQLLLQFYPLSGENSGQIYLDGQPINQIPLAQLRQAMAIVPQEVILFGGTIRENILYGNLQATADEVQAAAEKANAWEFINSFPDKMDTLVGERGVKLSGGQRQRVAIARALLKNPRILLLDEATSALDAESEQAVQAALQTLMQGRTAIIVAHRLATIRDCDNILVLQKGQIAEQGTHEQLINIDKGIYRQLSALQFTHDAQNTNPI